MSTPSEHVALPRPTSAALLVQTMRARKAAEAAKGGQGPVLQPSDVNVPAKEPMVAATANDNKNVDGAGKGGLTNETTTLQTGAGTSETEQERARQSAAANLPALAIYLAEKYFWKQARGGRFYLSPLPAYLDYVVKAARKAADFGLGLVYPDGEHDKTDEATHVAELAEHIKEMHFNLVALDPKEAEAFERYWIDRATRNAVYAATTQFELENWVTRAAASGNDPSSHSNFGEKQSRLDTFALKAGVGLAILIEAYPASNNYGEDAYEKAAKRVIYDAADMETSRLLTPQQLTEQQLAGAEAAKATVKRF